ncbi:MAG: helix-turn-helix domain-containing protein [Clostridia bacterium]|nr:helix-turn-helix domain-containing protein [Clostridia bacterium]
MFQFTRAENIESGEDIDVRLRSRTPENIHPMQARPHMHEFILLSYMQSGECTQLVDGVEYRTKRGDMLFIGMNQTHQMIVTEPVVHYNILLSSKFWSEELKNVDNFESIFALSIFNEFKDRSGKVSPVISLSGADIPDIEWILERMLREFEGRDIGWRAILKSYTQILITKLLRGFSHANKYAAVMLGDAMKKILEYIDVNLGSRLTLYELAEKCSYNPSYFSRIFKECFNMPFSEYVQQRRIHTAMELIRENRMSIEAIMETVGYSDKKSFYRYFKKITSQTPAEYKHNVLGQSSS